MNLRTNLFGEVRVQFGVVDACCLVLFLCLCHGLCCDPSLVLFVVFSLFLCSILCMDQKREAFGVPCYLQRIILAVIISSCSHILLSFPIEFDFERLLVTPRPPSPWFFAVLFVTCLLDGNDIFASLFAMAIDTIPQGGSILLLDMRLSFFGIKNMELNLVIFFC